MVMKAQTPLTQMTAKVKIAKELDGLLPAKPQGSQDAAVVRADLIERARDQLLS